MESPQNILTQTIFERLTAAGKSSALLSAKDKLANLLNKGPQIAFSAEKPPEWVVKEIGNPPPIYSLEVNSWLLRAAETVLDKQAPDFIYVATTDYVCHKYAPNENEAQRHLSLIDERIGQLQTKLGENLLCMTADHGMSAKTKAINLESALAVEDIVSWVIPTVKDKYVVHHSNLSGSAYIYIIGKQTDEVSNIINDVEGVERILTAEEAASTYHLPRNNVGDYFVLAEEDTVFGQASDEILSDVNIRSHGSLHEETVPIILHGDHIETKDLTENRDVTNAIVNYLVQVA